MTKGRHRKSIAAKKAPIATSTPNPDVVQLPLTSASTLLFACSHLDIDLASKESHTDLHNLNLWQASSKVVLDVLQLPKTAKEEQVDSNLQLDRTHLHEIWTLCSQFSLQGNEQPQMDRSNRFADTSSLLVERKPKSYVRKTEQF